MIWNNEEEQSSVKIDLIGELHQCLDDVQAIILSEDPPPNTGELEAQA